MAASPTPTPRRWPLRPRQTRVRVANVSQNLQQEAPRKLQAPLLPETAALCLSLKRQDGKMTVPTQNIPDAPVPRQPWCAAETLNSVARSPQTAQMPHLLRIPDDPVFRRVNARRPPERVRRSLMTFRGLAAGILDTASPQAECETSVIKNARLFSNSLRKLTQQESNFTR